MMHVVSLQSAQIWMSWIRLAKAKRAVREFGLDKDEPYLCL